MKFVYGFVAVASGLFTILNATNADRRWALGGFIVYIVALVGWVITTSGRRPRTDSARLRELARHSLDQAGDKPRTYTRSCLHDCATALVEVLDDRLCEGTLMHDLDRAKDRELAAMRTECAALRAACEAALKHADANGMQDWPVFKRLRIALGKTRQDGAD